MASLDPRLPIGDILAEPLQAHGVPPAERAAARARAAASWWACSPSTRTGIRRRSPAGSGSASASPGRWRSSRRCSCSTSRCRRSTCRFAPGVINLLERLKAELGLSYLFVAHDLVGRPAHRRSRGGDVPRPHRRDRRRRRGLRAAGPPLHAGAALGDPAARPAEGAAAPPHRAAGRPAEPGRIRRRAAASAPAARSSRTSSTTSQRQRASTSRRRSLARTGSADHLDACHYATPSPVSVRYAAAGRASDRWRQTVGPAQATTRAYVLARGRARGDRGGLRRSWRPADDGRGDRGGAAASGDAEPDQPRCRATRCRTAARSPGRSTQMPPNFNYNQLDGTQLDNAYVIAALHADDLHERRGGHADLEPRLPRVRADADDRARSRS